MKTNTTINASVKDYTTPVTGVASLLSLFPQLVLLLLFHLHYNETTSSLPFLAIGLS